jgi:hypothetical protein
MLMGCTLVSLTGEVFLPEIKQQVMLIFIPPFNWK